MLARATVVVDLAKVTDNARRICAALPGVALVGVTKVCCGPPEVARAMVAGGVAAIGDSRIENLARLRAAGIAVPLWLLRATPPGLADEVVASADVSLASELEAVASLDAAAERAGRRHAIVAMVDVGDLREGMMPTALPGFIESVEAMGSVDLLGIGTSLTCYGGIVPSPTNLGLLADLADHAEHAVGRPLLVSGGSSTSIALVSAGRAPERIDNLRIGEAILLGVDPSTRLPIPGVRLHTDAVTLAAPVIECMVKPSRPIGEVTQDAFGNLPDFPDRGERRRAICALGRQDAPPEGLVPIDARIEVLGASSDHLVLDVEAMPHPPALGDPITFVPGYSATLQAFTSGYVDKRYVGGA